MNTSRDFAQKLAQLNLSHLERAVALLWYYRQTQEFEERTASELANDLVVLGYSRPKVARLRERLAKSRFVVYGRRKGSFQPNITRLIELDEKYGHLLKIKKVEVEDSIIPNDWVFGTRTYLERMVHQINGCYQYGFYDACAVLCRRLMESLIIETYIVNHRHHEIQNNRLFLPLDKLISCIRSDNSIVLGKNTPKIMVEIKELGDAGAHDRAYITHKQDIDDIKSRYRRMIVDLLASANIRK